MVKLWQPATVSVLVVDDVREFREMYARYFSFAGVGVSTAIDGHEALDLARRYPPDAIVLDLSMPGMSGWQFLAEVQTNPELARIPVIVVTARHDEDASQAALLAGAKAFLTKPCLPEALLAEVRRVTAKGEERAS